MASNDDASRQLIRALETITAISEAQGVQLRQSRARAERLAGKFDSRLEQALEGVPGGPPLVDPEDLLLQPAGFHLQERETAFLDAFQALMQLWADESKRDQAEKIFGLLRAIRLADVEEITPPFAEQMPPFPKPELSIDPADRQNAMRRQLLDHHRSMREFMQSRLASEDEQIQLQDARLKEALDLARLLAG